MRLVLATSLLLSSAACSCDRTTPLAPDAGAQCAVGEHDDGAGGCTRDPCTPDPCMAEQDRSCAAQGGVAACLCKPGTHEEAGHCAVDELCLPTTCTGHGTCTQLPGSVSCACDPGWALPSCALCDAASGYHEDGQGGCTRDPCVPNPCPAPDRICRASGTAAQCVCRPGTHEQDGACAPDETCQPTSCNGHGTCTSAGGAVGCVCETGWALPNCASCDSAAGYHDDGAGGCTTDPCLPNPCHEPNRGVCTAGAASVQCGCDPGYHLEDLQCARDEACQPSSCSGHGTCSVVSGRVQCVCDDGYEGPACAACAAGYHADGAGGCTTDPCTPNPCTAPNKGACTAQGTQALCGCSPGYHDDGQGGCTNDPCVPNPCLATNQACRANAGQAECFTPDCDDQNPCTTDSVLAGGCQHTPLADGSPCQTSLCRQGQSCQSATCTAGTPIVCDDANPCTIDACDETRGCTPVANDSAIPSDGIECTADTCSSGVAAHAPQDARCDDGLFCTGVEVCAPGQQGADARGCRHTSVPAPPWSPPSPCRSSVCDEATDSFKVNQQPAGSACDDGLACTVADACDSAGACRGTATAACGDETCSATSPLGSVLEIPMASVGGRITINGGPPPQTSGGYDGGTFYLVARGTGAEHMFASYRYTWQSGSIYVLPAGGDRYESLIVAGVYDLLYSRGWASSGNYVYKTEPTEDQVNGYRILRKDVVIGLGSNLLDLDIPVADLSGRITINGGPPPQTSGNYDGASFYLVDPDTGAEHMFASYRYSWQSGSTYVLPAGGDRYAARLVAGTYDLLYSRGWASSGNYVYKTEPTDNQVNGYRIMRKGVVIPPGASTLDLDIGMADLSGQITINGGPPPQTSGNYDGASFYLVDPGTGAEHMFASYRYTWQSGGIYVLTAGGDRYAARIMPGTYDLLYSRGWASSGNYVYKTEPTDNQVNGYRIMRKGVVIPPGASTLDLDIGMADLSGRITINGGPPPQTSGNYDGASFYLVDPGTGAEHMFASYRYTWQSGSTYVLPAGGDRYAARIMPGTYDLLYSRGWASSGNYVYKTEPTDNQVNGYRIMRKGVVIPAGASTLDLDIGMADLSGQITINGGPPPQVSGNYDGAAFYLVDPGTGAHHMFASYRYTWQSGSIYVLPAGGDRYAARIMPGTYDLLYSRGWASSGNYVYKTEPTDNQVNGYRIMRKGVVIPPGASTLDLDIGMADLSGRITINGAPPPQISDGYDGAAFYLVDRGTTARHIFASYRYNWQSGSTYVLPAGGDLFSARIMPGVYDLLYTRGWASSGNYVYRTEPTEDQVNGHLLLRRCVSVP